jgi:hypothetical protein
MTPISGRNGAVNFLNLLPGKLQKLHGLVYHANGQPVFKKISVEFSKKFRQNLRPKTEDPTYVSA